MDYWTRIYLLGSLLGIGLIVAGLTVAPTVLVPGVALLVFGKGGFLLSLRSDEADPDVPAGGWR